MLNNIPLSKDDRLYRFRHSLAHILAQAVLEFRPGSRLGFGPPIEDGFYYDFILSSPLAEEDFPKLEEKMRNLIASGAKFIREDLPVHSALERIEEMKEPHKKEYAQELIQKGCLNSLSFYRSGEFLDMCEGPHVGLASEIPVDCFKLRNIAGAYWRGDSNNPMMTRIYAWAFESKAALDSHIRSYELALERDHKKLGKQLEIFLIDEEVGKGLPLWLPNGTVIRDELERFMKELEFKAHYQRVVTPHMARAQLYRKTGHIPYYEEDMYPPMVIQEKEDAEPNSSHSDSYYLRPMNCPHHHKIFGSKMRSYRDLPVRLAEYGQVYRYENSGALSGLLRVRGLCQNDAHIYCAEEQIQEELSSVLKLYLEAYKVLGIVDYKLRLSTWNPEDQRAKEKFVNNIELWEHCQNHLHRALQSQGLEFQVGKGEAAFYGPKIDVQIKTVTGREESASTIQLDFASAERMDLKYVGSDNQVHRPFIIHRAPLGSHERLVAILIEQYGGAFPTWLAPIQVRILQSVIDSWIMLPKWQKYFMEDW